MKNTFSKEWSANLAAMSAFEEDSADVDWGGRGWCWDGFSRSPISPFCALLALRLKEAGKNNHKHLKNCSFMIIISIIFIPVRASNIAPLLPIPT